MPIMPIMEKTSEAETTNHQLIEKMKSESE